MKQTLHRPAILVAAGLLAFSASPAFAQSSSKPVRTPTRRAPVVKPEIELIASRAGTFRSTQDSLTIDVAPGTRGVPTRITFADGAVISVSPSARLFGNAEPEGGFDLLTRRVNGIADGDTVSYRQAIEGADLLHRAGRGELATELILRQVPEPLQHGSYSVVFFEEVIDLPKGWQIDGLAQGSTLRTTSSLTIRDAAGTERAKLKAPIVFEALSQKNTAGHFAAAFAELTAQQGGVVTYRVGVPAAWLTASERSYPVVIDPTITQSLPTTITADPTLIDITPLQGWWNAVAVSSNNADWDLWWGVDPAFVAVSFEFDPQCDFVLANGNLGAITPAAGEADIFGSGPASATLEHGETSFIPLGAPTTTIGWDATQIVRVVEVGVATPGLETFTVNGPAGLGFALFRPGLDSAWITRFDADFVGAVGATPHSFDFNEAGIWAMVLFKDNGAGVSGNVDISWASAGYNLEAADITLDAASYPDQHQAGGTLTFTRDVTATGIFPPGATLDYAVYLSTDTTINSQDHELWSFQGAAPGPLQLSGFIPSTIADGTYFIGMEIDVVAGESDLTDNTTHDAISDHVVVITSTPQTPPTITLTAGQAAAVTATPQAFTSTPNQGVWNLVALNGDDWNLTVGNAVSNLPGSATDYVVANGNNGPVTTPTTGLIEQASGTGQATAFNTASSLINSSGQRSFTWDAGRIAHIFAHEITTTGDHTIDVTAPAGIRVAVHAPGTDSSYLPRTSAAADFAAGTQTTFDFNQAAFWSIVLYKDGAPSAAGTVTIDIQPVPVAPPTFNVEASALALQGGTGTLQLGVGDSLTFDRAIDVTGQLPAGASIDYTVYLSADQIIDAQDTVLHQFTGAAQGSASITEAIPQMAAGTYFVGIEIDAVAGETSATDNLRFEDGGRQIEVLAPATPFNLEAAALALSPAGTGTLQLDIGDAVTLDRTIDLTGTLPAGSAVDFTVYLTQDQVIDGQDTKLFTANAAATGAAAINATIPQMAPGTYFVAIEIDAVPGESVTTDNLRFEDGSRQIEVLPLITTGMNVIAVSAEAKNAPITINAGDTFEVDLDLLITSMPATTPLTFKVYLSTNNFISTLDTEVFAGGGPALAQTVTCTTPATMASSTYFVGVIVDVLAGESSDTDNTVSAIADDVTVVGVVIPPALTLVPDVPQTITQSDAFSFTPQQGVWNAIAVTASDPGDDWDISVGLGSSFNFNPDTDFVLADGHQGQIVDLTGDVSLFSGAFDATLEHTVAQPATVGTSAALAWTQGNAIKVFEVDVQTAGQQMAILNGPQGLRFMTFEPAFDAEFDDRGSFVQDGDVGPVPVQLDFGVTGVWAIAVFAEGGVSPASGTVSLDWMGPPVQGFDLAAISASIQPGQSIQAGTTIDVARLIANAGTQDSPAYVYAIYIAGGATIDPQADVKIFESAVQSALLAGSVNAGTDTVTIPNTIADGTYFIGLEVAQLQNDANTANRFVTAVETVDVFGGTGTVRPGVGAFTRGSTGSGGGCSFDAEGGSAPVAPIVLVLLGLVFIRIRRRLFA